MSVGALLLGVVPVYFVAHALQPVMAGKIEGQGDQYFGFVVVGMAAITLVGAMLFTLPNALTSGVSTGTLEALLATPTPLPTLLAGITGYQVIWQTVRALMLILFAWVLGANVAWDRTPAALFIILLLLMAHLPVGIVASAMVLTFRTMGPLPQGVMILATFLGGVYYPTQVIPSWIQTVSAFLPLTYGLRALRGVLLEGSSIVAVGRDVAILMAFVVVLLSSSVLAFALALRHARRSGTLAQY